MNGRQQIGFLAAGLLVLQNLSRQLLAMTFWAALRHALVQLVTVVIALVGLASEAEYPIVTVPAMDSHLLEYVPVAQGKKVSALKGFQTASLKREITVVFKGKMTVNETPCGGANVSVRILSDKEDQTAETVTAPDGTYTTAMKVLAMPNEDVTWSLQARTTGDQSLELNGRSITDDQDRILQLEHDLNLPPG